MNGTYLAQCHMFRVMAGAVTLEKWAFQDVLRQIPLKVTLVHVKKLVGWEDNRHILNFYVFLTEKKLSNCILET